jgi:hypothetical protein
MWLLRYLLTGLLTDLLTDKKSLLMGLLTELLTAQSYWGRQHVESDLTAAEAGIDQFHKEK